MKISEKLKVIEEKIKKYRSEEENKIKSEEEEAQIKKDENEQRWKTYQKVGGEYRTKKEIKEYLLPLLNYKNEEDTYQKQPKIKVPYESGKLSQETNDIAIKMFNFARFAVGIPNNVEIDPSYEKLAQDASLLMAVNDLMAHTGQPKPKNMKDDLTKPINTSSISVSKTRTANSEINVIGLSVDEAIPLVDKFLDDCALAKLKTARIVHGKGTGKLKTGIHESLKHNPHVKSYRMGTYGEGEMGVTIVELK